MQVLRGCATMRYAGVSIQPTWWLLLLAGSVALAAVDSHAISKRESDDNNSSGQQRVPDLRAELKDAQGRVVFSWTIAPQQRTLGPGASMDFNSAKLDVPPSSKRLDLSFAGESDPAN